MLQAFYLLLVIYLMNLHSSNSIFSMQQSLTILCNQFPFISNVNNSDLQCARLQKDEDISIKSIDLDRPTEIILFTIIDQLPIQSIPVNIQINFNQSKDIPSSIDTIYLSLLVTNSNFTINNQTDNIYTPYTILTFHWQISIENNYELIDQFQIDNRDFERDTSLCQWNIDRWNRVFYNNISINISYVYFLKTTNPQLLFTLIDTSNKSLQLTAPTPFLSVLYCIQYKLGVTEIVLIVCFGFAFITAAIILAILHFFKRGEEDRASHFQHYHHHQNTKDKQKKTSTNKARRNSNQSIPSSEYED